MSQNDMDISTGDANTGITFRAAVNDALKALASLSLGASTPSTTYAGQLWADTTNNKLKMRDVANGSWIIVGDLDVTYLGLASLAASNDFTATQKIKGDALLLRLKDTGASGKEWGLRSDGGNLEIVENTNTEGSPTWIARAKISSTGIVLPVLSSFSAHKNAVAQNTTAGVYTKLTFTTEVSDTSDEYDAVNSKFVPADTRARRLHAVVNISSNNSLAGETNIIAIYKNGSLLKEFVVVVPISAQSNRSLGISCIDVPNGTTDYYEVYAYTDKAEAISGTISRTFFEGGLAE